MTLLLARLRLILRAFGWRGLMRRLRYLAALRLGLLRWRLPVQRTFATSPVVGWQHRFDLDEILGGYAELPGLEQLREQVVVDAERMLAGELPFYGGDWLNIGSPPRWHVNPFTGHEYPRAHWTNIADDDPVCGDIKDVWEMSRLPFSFTFARAYVLTGERRFAEGWWALVEDWAQHNPPNLGVNWRCGQETSLRAISLCFGLSVFADYPESTPRRIELAHRILGASIKRVRPTVGYALSQRNNHAVSELVFLLSIRAHGDERRLLRYLLEVLDDQFYPDGSYAQQSFTYQRLAVQALQWLLIIRPDLPSGLLDRVIEVLARSRDFLTRCSDPVSGWLPNYGPNDGALLFHLTSAHYRDFRPLLAGLGVTSDAEHRETAIWLKSPEVTARETSADEAPTTYITLRGPRSLAFSRIGTGRHRTAHGDQQAIDLWIDGRNVVVDPGTYRYTAPAPWRNALSGPEVHSLPLEDGASQLSVGRFLSEGMPAAELVHQGRCEDLEVVVSCRRAGDGRIFRAIVRRADAYAVVDAAKDVDGRVRWNLGDVEGIDLRMEPPGKASGTSPVESDPKAGWTSPIYGRREPVEVRSLPLRAGGGALCRIAPADQSPLEVIEVHRTLAGTGLPGVSALAGNPSKHGKVHRREAWRVGRTRG